MKTVYRMYVRFPNSTERFTYMVVEHTATAATRRLTDLFPEADIEEVLKLSADKVLL